MDKQKCRLLIDLYKHHRSLWDSKHRNYHNSTVREDSWNEISSVLNLPVAEVKGRMKILMGTYRREKSRQKQSQVTGSGRDNIYVSKWFAFECFNFLSDRDRRNQSLNIKTEEPEMPTQDEIHIGQATETSDGFASPCSSTSIKGCSDLMKEPSSHLKRRKRAPSNSNTEDSALEKALTLLQKGTDMSTDAYFTYGQYIANELRKYDSRTLTLVKQAINNIIFEADMGRMSIPNYEYPEVQYGSPSNMETYSSTSPCTQVSTPSPSPNLPQSSMQPLQNNSESER